MHIFKARCRGIEQNTRYPDKVEVQDAASLIDAVSKDYVCAEYKDGKRANANFISSDCLALDCDNDHSENPHEWVSVKDVVEAFPDVTMYIHYSRNNMKEKNGKKPRPKFHVFFPINPTTNKETYMALKEAAVEHFPLFDHNAMDAGRFFFGTEDPEVEYIKGFINVDDFLKADEDDEFLEFDRTHSSMPSTIEEGNRNSYMSRFAGRILKRYGNTEKARECFEEEAAKCIPPLSDLELSTIWRSAESFFRRVSKQPGYKSPDEYGKELHIPHDFTDIGEAKVFSAEYKDVIAFTDSTRWLRYNGSYWNESEHYTKGALIDLLDTQLAESTNWLETCEKKLISQGVSKDTIRTGGKALMNTGAKGLEEYATALKYRTFILGCRDNRHFTPSFNLSIPLMMKDIKDFDSHEYLLNTPSRTYDLREGIKGFHDHKAEDHITKITECDPSDEGMDIWQDSLSKFFCNDSELIEYVQEIVGAAAIGKIFQEALIIAYGEGSNGKSTFWNAIMRVLGTYSGTLPADALTTGCKRNVMHDKAELRGKRLIIAAELEDCQRLNTSMVKQLCSTDEVTAEKKYKDPFFFKPTHTIVLYTNHLPKVGGRDKGTWRRLIIIPFNATITGDGDIKNYADYLVEKAGGAILKWIIEGAEKVIANDYAPKQPKCVTDAVNQYKEDNDWMQHFIDECCEMEPSYIEKSGLLYTEYRAYCTRSGDFTRSTTDFYNALENMGINRKKTKKGSFIYGIRLKSDFLI